MKKKGILITIAVMGIACVLLIGNAAAFSGFLSPAANDEWVEFDVAVENLTYTEKSVPTLKYEPVVAADMSGGYLAEVVTQDELQLINDYLDNIKGNIDISTRDLSDSELNRRSVLQDQYRYDGLRPETPLPLAAGDYDFYFDIKNDIYCYPERELKDEELLQYIEWTSKLNYALSLRYEQPKPSSKDIDKPEAVALATESIKNLFGVDTEALDISANFNDIPRIQSGQWIVSVSPYKMNTLRANGETFWYYIVIIDSVSGDIIDTTRSCTTLVRTKISESDMKSILSDNSWLTAAKSIVTEKRKETRKIKNCYINTADDGDRGIIASNSERGIVEVVVVLEDDATYIVELYYPDQSLRCLVYSD